MKLKSRLVKLYENIYTSNIILSILYWKQNRNYRLNILNSENTIKYIKDNECSIVRFGEGEIELILSPNRDLGFQKRSVELSSRLLEVLKSNNNKVLICIPYALNSIWGRTKHSRMFWYLWGKHENQHHRIIELIRGGEQRFVYGDTQITRPYIAYKNSKNAKKIFPKLKELWADKNIIIVEGEKTRLGVGNDLFSNVKSIKRILAPAVNAFHCYDKIKQAVVNNYNGELVLVALGPTATVLAYDLTNFGIQALDLGHVDIEYEWFLNDKRDHDIVPGKYTNEAEGGNDVVECLDKEYLNSIIEHVIQ